MKLRDTLPKIPKKGMSLNWTSSCMYQNITILKVIEGFKISIPSLNGVHVKFNTIVVNEINDTLTKEGYF